MASSSSSVPRAQTVERHGEVSCSIEETNRIRAALGLRPLDVGDARGSRRSRGTGSRASASSSTANSKGASPQTHHTTSASSSSSSSSELWRDRLAKQRRHRRTATQPGNGPVSGLAAEEENEAASTPQKYQSLGEALLTQDDVAGSASSWVQRSRQRGRAAPVVAPTNLRPQHAQTASSSLSSPTNVKGATTKAEGAYDTRALAGMRVAHDADAFAEGSEAILTLQDRSVLEDEGEDSDANGGELLENVELVDAQRQRLADRRRAAVKAAGAYGTHFTEEDITGASTGASVGGGGGGTGQRVLAHYDDDAMDEDNAQSVARKAATVLTADGRLVPADTAAAEAEAERVRNRLAKRQTHRSGAVDLVGAGPRHAAEFLTADEANAELERLRTLREERRRAKGDKKARQRRLRTAKKRRRRDEETEDGESEDVSSALKDGAAVSPPSSSAALIAELRATAHGDTDAKEGASDRGGRGSREARTAYSARLAAEKVAEKRAAILTVAFAEFLSTPEDLSSSGCCTRAMQVGHVTELAS